MNDTQLILNAIEAMGNRFDALESRFDSFESRLDALENEVETIKNDVRSINLTSENEIARSIGIIADDHVIHDHKSDKSSETKQKKEILLIWANHLEHEVRKLKEHINDMA